MGGSGLLVDASSYVQSCRKQQVERESSLPAAPGAKQMLWGVTQGAAALSEVHQA